MYTNVICKYIISSTHLSNEETIPVPNVTIIMCIRINIKMKEPSKLCKRNENEKCTNLMPVFNATQNNECNYKQINKAIETSK